MHNIGFGPIGFNAHGPDEFVNVDSLVKTAKVYLALALRLAEG
jgi:acetylornithine deacetylase/succinyl-diaminopimelate desuccinylase-like protein